MKGKPLYLVFLLLFMASPGRGEDYEAKSVTNDTVILKDRDSKKTLNARAGDTLENGWTVVSVKDDFVVIEKWIGEEEKIRGILPVKQVRLEVRK